MKALASILAAIVIVLSYLLYVQQTKITQRDKSIANLSAQVSKDKRDRDTFEYQQRCAEQARKTFDDLGYKKQEMAAYENHYNEKLNKCFIEITNVVPGQPGTMVTSRNISDALEGKTYGQYIWASDKIKKFWEVPPLMCKVILPSGEERHCKSDDEFKELLKPYMDIS